MNIKFASCVMAFSIFLIGCSKQNIEGEIFVKKNDTTKTLAGVKVGIVEGKSLIEAIDFYKKNAEKNLQDVYEKNRNISAIKNDIQVLGEIVKNLKESEEWYKPLDPALLPKALKLQLAATDKVSEYSRISDDLVVKAKSGKNSLNYVFPESMPYLASTETSSQGKYSINIPNSQQPILVASDESHLWAIILSNKDSAINLNNSNEFDSECGNCYFAQDDGKLLIASVSKFLKEVDSNNGEKKSEITGETHDELLKRSQRLISKCKANSARRNNLTVDEALVQGLSGTIGGIMAEADIEKKWLQLRIDITSLQSDHKQLTEEVIGKLEQIINKIN